MITKVTPEMAQALSNFIGPNMEKGEGWNFGSGDPEWFHFQRQLIKPGGWVLDLGSADGRSSIFFALNGMNVDAIDYTADLVKDLQHVAVNALLPICAEHADVRTRNFEISKYHVVVMSQLLIHFQSKADALQVIYKAIDAVAPGGYLWIRAVGKEDSHFKIGLRVDTDIRMIVCGCSGEYQDEPHLFFDQTELLEHICLAGMKPIHTQLLPEVDTINVMYGEDWHAPVFSGQRTGMISILAQKKR